MREYRISLDTLKENILDVQPNESILKKFEKINSQVRASLTKRYNETFKTSLIHKKKKAPKDPQDNIKYDDQGNVIEVLQEEDDDIDDGEGEIKVSTTKSKSKSKKQTTKKK